MIPIHLNPQPTPGSGGPASSALLSSAAAASRLPARWSRPGFSTMSYPLGSAHAGIAPVIRVGVGHRVIVACPRSRSKFSVIVEFKGGFSLTLCHSRPSKLFGRHMASSVVSNPFTVPSFQFRDLLPGPHGIPLWLSATFCAKSSMSTPAIGTSRRNAKRFPASLARAPPAFSRGHRRGFSPSFRWAGSRALLAWTTRTLPFGSSASPSPSLFYFCFFRNNGSVPQGPGVGAPQPGRGGFGVSNRGLSPSSTQNSDAKNNSALPPNAKEFNVLSPASAGTRLHSDAVVYYRRRKHRSASPGNIPQPAASIPMYRGRPL